MCMPRCPLRRPPLTAVRWAAARRLHLLLLRALRPGRQFPDEFARKHAATLVREVAKHTPELAQLVVANGGVGALVE